MFCYITGERRRKMRKKKKKEEEEEEEKEKDEEEEERWGRKRRTITTTTRWGEEDKSVSQLSPDTKRNVSIFLPTAGKIIHQSEPEVGLRWGSDVSYTTWQQHPCVTWTNVTHWSEPEPDARLLSDRTTTRLNDCSSHQDWSWAQLLQRKILQIQQTLTVFRPSSLSHGPICSQVSTPPIHSGWIRSKCPTPGLEARPPAQTQSLLQSELRETTFITGWTAERLNAVFTQQFKVQLLLHFTQL